MRLRVKFNKINYLKYIGHLDLLRLLQRALNKASIPVKYTKGFNPTPRFAIANPLSLGIEGEEEYMDIELEERIDILEFKEVMNSFLPRDVQILDCKYVTSKESIAAIISHGLYEFSFQNKGKVSYDDIQDLIHKWLSKDEVLITRMRKRGRRKVEVEENILPLIKDFTLDKIEKKVYLRGMLKVGESGNLRPFDFMEVFTRENSLLGLDKDDISYKRIGLFIEEEGSNNLRKPF